MQPVRQGRGVGKMNSVMKSVCHRVCSVEAFITVNLITTHLAAASGIFQLKRLGIKWRCHAQALVAVLPPRSFIAMTLTTVALTTHRPHAFLPSVDLSKPSIPSQSKL